MKKNTGILLLLISVAVTTIGSVFKVMNQSGTSEVFLWIGMITFVVAIGNILYRIAKPLPSDHRNL